MTCGGQAANLAASNPGVQKFFLGAIGLPFGLCMCLICGAELFIGNTMLLAAAMYEGKAKVRLQILLLVYLWIFCSRLATTTVSDLFVKVMFFRGFLRAVISILSYVF